MNWLQVIGIAVGLAMDAFAVSIAAGLTIRRLTGRHVFRISWHFGLFQFMTPELGWLAGRHASKYVAAYDHWVAFGLLLFVGGKMLWDALKPHTDDDDRADPSRGLMLMTLSVATSLDAFAVGVSMAMLNVSVWGPSVVIGLVAGTLSLVGITFGSRIGKRWGHVAEVFGGGVLIAIGIWALVSS